jgi:hypothetical protein
MTFNAFLYRLNNELSPFLMHRKYDATWVEEEVLCSPVSNLCRRGECQKCSSGGEYFLRHQIADDVDYEEELAVQQWRRDERGFLLRSTVTMTLADAVALFRNKLPAFTLHHLTKRHQATVYRMHKEELDSETIVIHFDFAENYCCASQDQIQAAYYGQRLVSIFTCVIHSQHLGQSGWYPGVVDIADADEVRVECLERTGRNRNRHHFS